MRTHSILALAIIALLAGTAAEAKYSGGTGEPNNPYQIGSAQDLLALAADTNDYNKCFILTVDIDPDLNLPGNQVFTSAVIARDVDKSNSIFDGNAFSGTFDGNGHTLRNLVIDTNGYATYLGLFGATDSNSNIRKLNLENVFIHTGNESGLLGLLSGNNFGTITDCSATGHIIAEGDWTYDIGGLVGWNQGGKIALCRSDVSVSGFYYVGGLVGVNFSGTFFRCCTGGETIGADYAGGLVAANEGIITQCFSTGNVVGTYNGTGGLVGCGHGTILNCYATGNVSGNWSVGGLAGGDATITACYSTGRVSGEGQVGGLIGICEPGSVTDSFWDINTSGQTISAGGEGKTTAEMKTLSTFTSAGWDFVEIWGIEENQTYPYLRTEPAGDLNHDQKVDFEDLAILALHWLEGTEP